VPEPTTAWLWRPGESRGRRGTLSLDAGSLKFHLEDGEVVRLTDLERARRQRGTPVLEIRYRRDGEPRVALVFFTRPPELPDRPAVPTPMGVLGARGLRRVGEMGRLRSANRRLKPLVEEWVRALRG
jgi:hypothetical protein